MAYIEHAIHIDASPAAVWAVLVDVERWPAWTPTMNKVARLDDRPFGLGCRARINQPGGARAIWTSPRSTKAIRSTGSPVRSLGCA